MQKINWAIFFIFCLNFQQTYGMKKGITLFNISQNQTSRINIAQFKELAGYSATFLNDHINELIWQKNESGFIRLSIPLKQKLNPVFNNIKSLRLNYWRSEADVKIQPESIHTHPNYFESYIINGGYTHAIYDKSQTGKLYKNYLLSKNGTLKTSNFINDVKLTFVKNESFSKGNIITFNKYLIHKVLNTIPQTLTLNVVFKENQYQATYNVFLSEKGLATDVKKERSDIEIEDSKLCTKEANAYLLRI